MKIDYLAHHCAFIPVLETWFVEEWRDYFHDNVFEARKQLLGRLFTDRLPISWVAYEHDQPVGSVSLVKESLASFPHYSPWVAGLLVHRSMRRQGVGTKLLEHVIKEARRLGLRSIYMAVRKHEGHYEKHGWVLLEKPVLHHETISILRWENR